MKDKLRFVTEKFQDWFENKYESLSNRNQVRVFWITVITLLLAYPILCIFSVVKNKSFQYIINGTKEIPGIIKECREDLRQDHKARTKLHRVLK